MKVSSQTLWILAGAGLAAGLVVYGSWNWRMRNEAQIRLRAAEVLESRDRQVLAATAEANRRIGELDEVLQAASNRTAEINGQLDEEKNTHEPLRRQIEKMMAEEIGVKDSLAQKDKTIEELRAQLADAGQKDADLSSQNRTHRERNQQLESELESAKKREADTRAQLAERLTKATALGSKLDDVQKKLEDALRRLETSERAVSDLRKAQSTETEGATTAVAGPKTKP